MFDDATVRAVGRIAARVKVEPAALLAVAEVESAGRVHAKVFGRLEPMMRWEGHYFDDRLTGAAREKARRLGLAHPKAGRVKNPRSQEARWRKLYLPASEIDPIAAFESASWGLGQVMGAHWSKLEFANAGEMLKMARANAAGQIELMARYIENFGLVDELQRGDFRAFTRGYNGPGGIKAGYHTKMAKAYARISGGKAVSAASGMLRMGSTGARVRELQALLVRAGHALKVDGDYGPATKQAVMVFQRANGLQVDGVVGPETMRALSALKVTPEERPGALRPLETSEGKEGLVGVGSGAGLEAASQTVQEAADKTAWVPGLEWISAILSIVAVLLVLGGLAWMGWGWWKSRQTDEGDALA